ncbi:penicillin-binding transpeptidase domain-containing protein [Microbacterium sp. gxy059]|uniref:penicillin-binding transpeptidase domain-containing protein n=1 Tax=Microbacterium sp. gxy059 TaxID=2957199 RepID=UPI003D99E991
MTSSPRRALALLLVVPLLGLTACTADDGLDEAIGELTEALSAHDLSAIPGADDELVAPLADYPLEVTAGEATRDGDRAEVPLAFAWEIEGRAWTYAQTATLVREDDAWEVEGYPSLVADGLAEGETIEVRRSFADRAPILGADDEEIVAEREVTRYGLDKSWISADEVASSARAVAEAVGVDADEFVARAEQMGELAFVEAIVLRPEDAADRVPDDFSDIPGANAIEDTMLLAPTRAFARGILGSVGEATAEIIEGSEGAVREGDRVGLGGLQAAYDAQLRGAPAIAVEAVACEEDEPCVDEDRRALVEWDAEEGEPLRTSLDVGLQKRADAVLADQPGTTALVAIRPSTGEILALADGPDGDIANAAATGQYPPGSTFKIATALALLRAGATPDDAVTCADRIEVDGYAFRNHDEYPDAFTGEITLREAVAHSCNTALIGERDAIDGSALESAAAALGIGLDAEAGLPVFTGSIPEPESETELAADMIGQGRVLASPLAMATAAASVAAGKTVTPVLVAGEGSGAEPAEPLTADEAETLRGLMRAVVTDGSATFLDDVDPAVGAKTGTAEHGEADDDGRLARHGWMIATQGDLAVAVFVEDATSGAEDAGPILKDFLR